MQRRMLLTGALAAGVLCSVPALAAQEQDPFDWVVGVTNDVLTEIRNSPALKAGDMNALQKLVDRQISTNVDFVMATRMTVGPKWRTATAEQREKLMKEFQLLLMRIYAGGLKTVSTQVCELRPTRNRTVSDQMVIRTLLRAPGEKEVGIDYRIYKNKAGEWRIVDMNVEGVWMVENYRSQFADTLNREGVEGLIRLLEQKNSENTAKNTAA